MTSLQTNQPDFHPWVTWIEWQDVKHCLFHTTTGCSAQLWALDALQTWRLKGELPIAVEATSQLVHHQTLLATSSPTCDGMSDLPLRLSISSSIVRMVNSFVDLLQQSTHAQSVTQLAESINLPRMLVDIRHDATHGSDVPTLELLREAVQMALQWLYDTYWAEQDLALELPLIAVNDLLTAYKRLQSGSKPAAEVVKQLLELCVPAGQTADSNNSHAHATLLHTLHRVILPSLLTNDCLLRVPQKQVAPTTNKIRQVMTKLIQLWEPLLTALNEAVHYTSFSLALLEQLVMTAHSLHQAHQASDAQSLSHHGNRWQTILISAWFVHLVPMITKRTAEGLTLTPVDQQQLLRLLQTCLTHSTDCSTQLMDELTNAQIIKYNVDAKLATTILQLVHAHSIHQLPLRTMTSLADMQSLVARIEQQKAKPSAATVPAVGNQSDTSSPWTELLDADWHACPLGALPVAGSLTEWHVPGVLPAISDSSAATNHQYDDHCGSKMHQQALTAADQHISDQHHHNNSTADSLSDEWLRFDTIDTQLPDTSMSAGQLQPDAESAAKLTDALQLFAKRIVVA